MNAPAWLIILISALTDLLIVSGSTLIGAMLATGEATLPTLAVWLVSGLSGLVAAGKEVRSSLKLPPTGGTP
jgi:hypothetical protein